MDQEWVEEEEVWEGVEEGEEEDWVEEEEEEWDRVVWVMAHRVIAFVPNVDIELHTSKVYLVLQ